MECNKCHNIEKVKLPCNHNVCLNCLFCFVCPICNNEIVEYDFLFEVSYSIVNNRLKINSVEIEDNFYVSVIYDSKIRIFEFEFPTQSRNNVEILIDLDKLENFKYICLRKKTFDYDGLSSQFINIHDRSIFMIDGNDEIRYISQIKEIK